MRRSKRVVTSALLCLISLDIAAQQARVPAPHKPVAPRVTSPRPSPRPAVLRSLVGGFWMAGPDQKATLHLSNDVVTNSIAVTPILHMSSGEKLRLPQVTLDPAGMA